MSDQKNYKQLNLERKYEKDIDKFRYILSLENHGVIFYLDADTTDQIQILSVVSNAVDNLFRKVMEFETYHNKSCCLKSQSDRYE